MPNFTDKSEPDFRGRKPLSEGGFPWWKYGAFVPVVLACVGWLVTHEARVQRLEEIAAQIKEKVSTLDELARDPGPKPETRVAIESFRRESDDLRRQLEKIEERLNNLHLFIRGSEEWRPRANGKRGFLDPPADSPLIR